MTTFSFCDGKVDSKDEEYMMAVVVVIFLPPAVHCGDGWGERRKRGLVAEWFRFAWHAKPQVLCYFSRVYSSTIHFIIHTHINIFWIVRCKTI